MDEAARARNGTKTLRGMGRIFQRGGVWWVAYYFNGKEVRESSKSQNDADAKRLLKKRLKEIHGSRYAGPQEEKLTVDELLDGLVTHLETKGAKTVERLKSHLKPLKEWFALTRGVNVTTADVEKYVADRLKLGKARATVNREIGALKQALNLARKQARLTRVPYIPMLREDNARSGFFVRGLPFSVHRESEPAAVWSILSENSRGLRPLRDR